MAPHEENHGLDRYDHLARLDPPVRFTLPYLQQLHRELYAGTDRLAGDLRWSDAAYARGSDAYLPRRELEPRLGALTAQLHREGALVSVSDGRKWADRAGYYAAELSHAQPFRAGNGPTTRLYLQRLAEAGGHQLDWDRVIGTLGVPAINKATRAGQQGDYEPMRKVLQYGVTGSQDRPDRGSAPRFHLDLLDGFRSKELKAETAVRSGAPASDQPHRLQAGTAVVNSLRLLEAAYATGERFGAAPTRRPAARTRDEGRGRDRRDGHRDRGQGR